MAARRGGDLLESSHGSNLSSRRSVERGILPHPVMKTETRLGTREKMYKESQKFARSQNVEYEQLLLSPAATDPMNVETDYRQSPDEVQGDLQLTDPPRDRWAGMYAAIAASFCDTLDVGSESYVMVFMFKYWAFGAGLAVSFLINLVFVIMPVLAMEQLLGQVLQGTAVKCYAVLSKRTRTFGLIMFCLTIIRMPLHAIGMSESLLYLYASFRKTPAWFVTEETTDECLLILDEPTCASRTYCEFVEGECIGAPMKHAELYYENTLIGGRDAEGGIRFHTKLLFALLVAMFLVSVTVFLGLPLLGQFAIFTSIGSLIFFLFLSIISLGLTGATSAFWSTPAPVEGEFSTGIGSFSFILYSTLQTFGLGQGCQYTIGSFSSVSANTTQVALIILIMRVLIMVLFAITTICLEGHAVSRGYHWSFQSGQPWYSGQQILAYFSGKRLNYVTFPLLMGLLPAAPVYAFIFYLINALLNLLTICTDVLSVRYFFHDSSRFENYSSIPLNIITLSYTFLASLPLCIILPDIYHFEFETIAEGLTGFIYGWATPLAIAFSVIAATWTIGFSAQTRLMNSARPTITFLCCWFASIAAAVGVRWLFSNLSILTGVYFAIIAVCPIVAFPIAAMSSSQASTCSKAWTILMGDVDIFRKELNAIVAGESHCMRVPLVWGVCLKFIAPWATLSVLLVNLEVALGKLLPGTGGGNAIISLFYAGGSCAIVVLGLMGIICYSCFNWIVPSEENDVHLRDVPRKRTSPPYFVRRRPFRVWEEFLAPASLWDRAFELELRKLA